MDLREMLQDLKEGRVGIDEAVSSIRQLAVEEIEGACLDIGRSFRKDVPEIVLAEGKAQDDLVQIIDTLLRESKYAIVTRVDEARGMALSKHFGTAKALYNRRGRVLVLRSEPRRTPQRGGKVALFTAGTADIGVAEEAKTILEELGCKVLTFYDRGIAGLQRVFPAVRESMKEDVDVIIVVAGMEGALASIVSSLVPVPVIGVPSSAGYGLGGQGEGALISMLQTCSPGLLVVNIDNGVGAAVAASLIARRCSRPKDSER